MKTYYIRYIGDSWHRPIINRSDIDVELDFGKFIIGRSDIDLHGLISEQLDDLRKYDELKKERHNFKGHIEKLEKHTKKLSDNIEELTEKIDDLELEKSDLEDEVFDIEQAAEALQFEIDYRENRTYE